MSIPNLAPLFEQQHPCEECGIIQVPYGVRFCSNKCQGKNWRKNHPIEAKKIHERYYRKKYPLKPKICPYKKCPYGHHKKNNPFTPHIGNQKYCSKSCQRRATYEKHKREYPSSFVTLGKVRCPKCKKRGSLEKVTYTSKKTKKATSVYRVRHSCSLSKKQGEHLENTL